MRTVGAQVHDRGRKEPPLHARLDLQRRVGDHEFFELREVAAVVVESAEGHREGAVYGAELGEALQLPERAGAVLLHRLTRDDRELVATGELTRRTSHVGPATHEGLTQRGDVDLKFVGAPGNGGAVREVGHDPTVRPTPGGVRNRRRGLRNVPALARYELWRLHNKLGLG